MATKTGTTGQARSFSDGKFPIGVTMAANEYPTKIKFHISYPSPCWRDSYPQGGGGNHRVDLYLCDSSGNNQIYLFRIGWDSDEYYVTTPYEASVSNTKGLKGKALYILPKGSDVSLANTGLNASCQVTVTTSADPYSVSTSSGGNGTLSASATSVYPGNTVTLTATPASGYQLDSITANVTLSGSGNTRTFTMPYSNVTANATFSLIPAITWSADKSLSFRQIDDSVEVSLTGTATHNYGYAVTYKLYKGGVYVTDLSNSKATVSISAGELDTTIAYKVVAEAGGLTADGPSANFKAVSHTLGWSGASLTGSQVGRQVTMTYGGSATDSWGKTVSYYLYKENTYVDTFRGTSLTITADVNELGVSKQYKVVAAAGGLTADGKTIAYTAQLPTVTWESGAQMYGQEVDEGLVNVGVTKGAQINYGFTGTVYYRVYIENVRQNEDGDSKRDWTLEPLEYGAAQTYKIDAYAVIEGMTISSTPFTMEITVEERSRTVKYYDGSGWIACVMNYYDGTDFVEVEPYYYDGNEWILCSMT